MAVPAVSLRQIGERDRDFLYAVYEGTRAEEMAMVDWSAAETAAFLRMQFEAQHKHYMEHYASSAFDLLLDPETDAPIGRLYLDRREKEFRIVDIALLPDWRRLGIGGALLRSILDEAGRAGKAVSIHVESNNPAMGLYERLGFRHIDTNGVYHLMEWTPAS